MTLIKNRITRIVQHKPKEWNIHVHNAPTITDNSLLESTRSWDWNPPQAATRILPQTIILKHIFSKTPNRVLSELSLCTPCGANYQIFGQIQISDYVTIIVDLFSKPGQNPSRSLPTYDSQSRMRLIRCHVNPVQKLSQIR